MPTPGFTKTVDAAGANWTTPSTSQSPADNGAVAQFTATLFVMLVPVVAAGLMNSPTLPAFALSPSAVPTMPAVDDGVIAPVAVIVVKRPVLAVVAPIGVLLMLPPVIVGDVIVGLVPNTSAPLPVSSETTLASCADVVAAN